MATPEEQRGYLKKNMEAAEEKKDWKLLAMTARKALEFDSEWFDAATFLQMAMIEIMSSNMEELLQANRLVRELAPNDAR